MFDSLKPDGILMEFSWSSHGIIDTPHAVLDLQPTYKFMLEYGTFNVLDCSSLHFFRVVQMKEDKFHVGPKALPFIPAAAIRFYMRHRRQFIIDLQAKLKHG